MSVNQLSQLTEKMSVLNKIIKKTRKSYSLEIKEEILKETGKTQLQIADKYGIDQSRIILKNCKKKQEIIDIYCIYKVIN